MSSESETILREALALQDNERADLAAHLLASLDPPTVDDPTTIDEVWAAELERRARKIVSGEVPVEDWAAVRDRVADQLNG